MTIGLLAPVFGLALLDSLNPSALAVTLYLLLAGKSIAPKVLTYVAAVFLAYFGIGALLMLGLGAVVAGFGEYFESPVAYGIQGVIGAAMLLYSFLAPGGKDKGTATRLPRSQRLGAIFLLGLTITVVEFSTALPYLAAIGILTNADLAAAQWLPILIAYNLIFVSPPLLLLLAYRLSGDRLQARFARYRERLQKEARATWLWIVGILGFLLLVASLRYFGFFGLVDIPDTPQGP